MRGGISLFSGDADIFFVTELCLGLVRLRRRLVVGMLHFQHTKFCLVSLLVWEGYCNAHFNHIMWLCSETASESFSFMCLYAWSYICQFLEVFYCLW